MEWVYGNEEEKWSQVDHLLRIDADTILEEIAFNVYDVFGDLAGNYLSNVTLEHKRILEGKVNQVILEWNKEFGYEPDLFAVEEIQKIED